MKQSCQTVFFIHILCGFRWILIFRYIFSTFVKEVKFDP
jgi:hypothetical protein